MFKSSVVDAWKSKEETMHLSDRSDLWELTEQIDNLMKNIVSTFNFVENTMLIYLAKLSICNPDHYQYSK